MPSLKHHLTPLFPNTIFFSFLLERAATRAKPQFAPSLTNFSGGGVSFNDYETYDTSKTFWTRAMKIVQVRFPFVLWTLFDAISNGLIHLFL
jgi:hypothetical protein